MTNTYRQHEWLNSFPGAVVICDSAGIIVEMNPKAADSFKEDGGFDLLGKNLLDCHPEPSRSQVKEMLASHASNYYTIEKNGVKKLIYQVPWFDEQGTYAGFAELSLPVPFAMPHFIRK